jgi:hypothetical protein
MVCEKARNREEFLAELRKGHVRVEGSQGWYFTLTGDILRLTAGFYKEGIIKLIEQPLDWKRELLVLCSTLGLPLVSVAILVSLVHYLQDERFNRGLLFDLVARSQSTELVEAEPQTLEAVV